MSKVLGSVELRDAIERLRISEPQRKIVLCHGVFDLVHPGHLEHFVEAKKYGDLLIVSITADLYINKGPNRPYFDQARRASFLSALEIVDFVYVVESDSAVDAISVVKPDFYIKGSEYEKIESDITGKMIIEKHHVESFGGKVIFTHGFTSSSTRLINELLLPQDSELRKWVKDFKQKVSLDSVNYWIDNLRTVELSVLGETIIDAYTECRPLTKSSKDPILAFHRFDTHEYLGGVLAIADSCSNWSLKTKVYSVCGRDFEARLESIGKSTDYEKYLVEFNDRPTITKHRFVDMSSMNRVFEFYQYNPEPLETDEQNQILTLLNAELNKKTLLLIADYGHGFFGETLIDSISASQAFLSVNTQANAGNRGFNTFSKYPRIDFLCLNGGELELELRKKNIDFKVEVPRIMQHKGISYAVVTLGAGGLLTFDRSGESTYTPALASRVVDKVGAGDSVLAMASMLAYLGAPKEIIGLLSSVVAAFEVSQLGHQKSLGVVEIKRFIKGLLG